MGSGHDMSKHEVYQITQDCSNGAPAMETMDSWNLSAAWRPENAPSRPDPNLRASERLARQPHSVILVLLVLGDPPAGQYKRMSTRRADDDAVLTLFDANA